MPVPLFLENALKIWANMTSENTVYFNCHNS